MNDDRFYLEKAARKLVHGFTSLEHDDVRGRIERCGGEIYAFPMWGTVFEVIDACDASHIRDLIREPFEDDMASILEFAADHGLELDANDYATADDSDGFCCKTPRLTLHGLAFSCVSCGGEAPAEFDAETAAEDVMERWEDSGDELCHLHRDGWRPVGDTGILALEGCDGGLYLGIHGAGYEFYEAHWTRLYLAMDYGWHRQEKRNDAVMSAARRVVEANREMRMDDLGDAIEDLTKAYDTD